MYLARLLGGVLLLTALSFGQQSDTSRNASPDAYSRDTYNRPVEVTHSYGGWGLLGLLGLAGLFGSSRRNTVVRDPDEYVMEQRRRAS
jgi:MYXO-CTERM domain-containing protein